MRISDWSSDVCSSDLDGETGRRRNIQLVAIEEHRNFARHAFGGRANRLVDMDVAARHRSGGMAEHRRDRQFRIAQFACDAPERMPERVRRYIGPSESVANSAQHSISRDKVRLPAVRGEYIGAAVLNRLFSEHE